LGWLVFRVSVGSGCGRAGFGVVAVGLGGVVLGAESHGIALPGVGGVVVPETGVGTVSDVKVARAVATSAGCRLGLVLGW
jgi:hypothetical protein